MINGKRKIKLTSDAVLEKISEYDIFRFYMPTHDWKLNKVTYSPFRQENNPSFVIGNKRGFVSFIDFADTSRRGNCFDFVKLLFNLSTFDDVLRLIDRDFGLGIVGKPTEEYKRIVSEYKQPELEKRYSLIQVKTRKFTQEELAYWNLYHQDLQDLRDNSIYSIKELYLNKSKFPLKDTEIRFGYLYEGQYWKIYRPFADKKNKWMPNNVPITTMDGKEDIKNCSVAFINKSKKDYMVMKKVFPCSCAVQNEGIGCFSHENVEFLKANSDKQILSFDSDVTGVSNSQQITKLFDFEYANVPRKYLIEGIKDWADLAKTHGLKAIEDYLKTKKLL
jgi:DNA primase